MKFDWLFNAPVAHRGLHDKTYPENSIPAFEAAIKEGFNIEIDVHLSVDGHLVIFHDDNLKRVCGVDKKVNDCTLAELKSMKLAGTDYTIPTFDEFLSFVEGKTGILCEIKGTLPWDHSISEATLKRLETYKGNIALQSFNFGAMSYCRKHCSLPCGQLCAWRGPKNNGKRKIIMDFMGKLWVLKISKPHFVAYDVNSLGSEFADGKYVKKAIKKLPFLMWTVNDENTLNTALKNANNIIFENLSSQLVHSRFSERLPLSQKFD